MSEGTALEARQNCPNRDNHTDRPIGYAAWHEWARNMGKTHRQIRCDGCGLYAIWLPKAVAREEQNRE